MKNLFKGLAVIILLLSFVFTKAQVPIKYTPMTAGGYEFFGYVKADSGLNVPNRDTSTGRGTRRGGSMVFDSTNRLFYGWDGIRWTVLGSSTTTNNFVDSITVSGNNVCQWINGVPKCYTITGGGTFTGVDSLTYTGNSLCWWKAGIPTCYAMIPGVDSITVINNIFCQYKNGVPTCDTITGNVLGVFVDSVTVVGTQLCQYRAGVATCYTINSISNGVDSLTFIDSVLCSWSGGVSTCINIAGQRDSVFVKGPILRVDNTSNPGHQTLYTALLDGFIVKPIVTWSGTGLTFNVTYGDYVINQVEYISPPTTITLAPADLTDPRNDLFVVDTFATAKALTGIAAAVPLIPQFDEGSQLPLTSGTLINPGDTVPTGVVLRIIYNENLGLPAEWLATPPAFPNVSDYNDLSNPYNGVKAIFLSSYRNSAHLRFLDFSGTYIRNTVVPGDVITLAFWTNGVLNSRNNIFLKLYDSTIAATNTITITSPTYGFIRSDSNHYQILTIPLSAFTFVRPNYTTLDFITSGYDTSGAKGIFIDYITIQSNLNNIPPPTDYSNKVDSVTVVSGSDYYWIKGVSHLIGTRSTGGSGGVTLELAPIGSTPNANAATLVGDSVLNLEPANISFGGIITASNTPQFVKGQKSIVSITDSLFTAYFGTIRRTALYKTGAQGWNLNDGASEVGTIAYSTPVSTPGMLFINSSGTGRSQIRQYIDTGGISIGSEASGSALALNYLVVLNNGHTFINGGLNTAVTDNGYMFNVAGTSYLSSTITANSLSGSGTRMVVADPTGILGTQAIPSGSGGGLQHVVGQYGLIQVNDSTLKADSSLLLTKLGAAATYQTIITTSEQEVTASGSLTLTFSSLPTSTNDIKVYRNGVLNEVTTDFTKSGNNITFVTGGLVTGDRVVVRTITH